MSLTHAHPNLQNPARLVVLGAGGFLGRRLVKAAAEADIATLALSSRDADLADPAAPGALAKALQPNDAVVFLSALTPNKGRDSGTLMRNLAMARAVAEASRSVELAQLVYASSDAVYSFDDSLLNEATPAAPLDLYGIMHRARELILAGEAKAPLAILRFTAVYGSGDTHNSYGPNRFVRQAIAEGRISLFGEGEETRDHLHVDDAVDVILKVVGHGSRGLINVASGKSMAFRDVANLVGAGMSSPVEIVSSERKNNVTYRHFDTTDLLAAFPNLAFKSMPDALPAMLAAAKDGGRG
jgi:nucleoside-diphosphate-sugar epimerase